MPQTEKDPGYALALSGGGFRATLFHIGSLWRLNELGVLPRLAEITSVSGGSIIAGFLGLQWKALQFGDDGAARNFESAIAVPLRSFCARTIDRGSIGLGIVSPFHSPGKLVAGKYDKHLYGGASLRDLPDKNDGPRFTIYATNMQTGRSVRICRDYIADYMIGMFDDPDIPLAQAVAASSAFPPLLCPLVVKLDPKRWRLVKGATLFENESLRKRLLLFDGGVYDNMGLERVWDRYQTVLVSDAGAPFKFSEKTMGIRLSQVSRTMRTLSVLSDQARALRKRRLMDDFEAGVTSGAYWGIGTTIANYRLEKHGRREPLTEDNVRTEAMASIRTRLNKFDEKEQGELINWGYALTDAAMRRHVLDPEPVAGTWPAPAQSFA